MNYFLIICIYHELRESFNRFAAKKYPFSILSYYCWSTDVVVGPAGSPINSRSYAGPAGAPVGE